MASNITTQNVDYKSGATHLKGFLAWDGASGGKRPGVIVVHEWWGLTDYPRRRASMLAELGYVGMAVDMYGDGSVGADPAAAGALMQAAMSDPKALEARFEAAADLLRGQPQVDPNRIAAIGYCFGGAVCLHMARIGMNLAGVVSFHGALGSMHKPARGGVKARVLVCHGAADSLVPDDQVAAFKQEMDEAGAKYKFVPYAGALHGFSNPEADDNAKKYGMPLGYDAAVDQRSWDEMQAFFKEIF
ncbi:MAG: dienelactone hydrolase family protein [Gammaproteobacteria bacterium]